MVAYLVWCIWVSILLKSCVVVYIIYASSMAWYPPLSLTVCFLYILEHYVRAKYIIRLLLAHNTMMSKRVAALLVFAIVCSPKVAVHGHCTRAQKEAIIIDCAYYILRDKPGGAPQPWSRCCRTAREVPGMDMDCIVKLLKLQDQEAFGKRIRDLEVLCVVHSPPHLLNIITR